MSEISKKVEPQEEIFEGNPSVEVERLDGPQVEVKENKIIEEIELVKQEGIPAKIEIPEPIKGKLEKAPQPVENYKELYGYAKDVQKETQERSNRLDTKAVWLLSTVAILIGIASAQLKWVADSSVPPKGRFDWFICFAGAWLVFALLISLYKVIRVFWVQESLSQTLDKPIMEKFEMEIASVYWALTKSLMELINDKQKRNYEKARLVLSGQKWILTTMGTIIFLCVMYVTRKWLK